MNKRTRRRKIPSANFFAKTNFHNVSINLFVQNDEIQDIVFLVLTTTTFCVIIYRQTKNDKQNIKKGNAHVQNYKKR